MSLSPRGQRRFHLAFVTLVFVLGFAALADSIWRVDFDITKAPSYMWILLAILVFASGRFAVKVPAMAASIGISEVFLFSMVMMYGSAPAVITVAVDGLAVSLIRRHHRPKLVAFNLAEPALSMWVASKLYFALAGIGPLSALPPSTVVTIAQVGLPALALCAVYFLMNSWLNAIAMTSESGASPFAMWRKYFLWVSLNYFGGASIAVLLSVNARTVNTFVLLVAIVPLIIVSYYMFKSSMGRLEDENIHLGEVNRLYLKVVEALAMAVDAKDQVTHGHICRVQTYALQLAKTLNVTDPKEIQAIEAAALLHDMGKLAIPEHILNKPGKLTADEFERMKLHAPLGAEMLSSVDFPYPVVPIVRHHHESWDGTGYPDGVSGDAIPIGARILSVVDCYDALRSHRPYRRALSPAQAMEIIKERRGTMYDPTVVDAFAALQGAIEAESVEEPLPAVLDQFSQVARESCTTDTRPSPVPLELRLFATNGLLRLYDQISTLGPDANLADTCDVVVRYLRRMAPAGLVVFYRKDDTTDEIVVEHASGFGEALLPDLRIEVGHGISGWVVANRRSILNADPALDVGPRLDELNPRFRSALSIPLTPGTETTGAVTLYSDQPNAFTDDQRLAIEMISGAVAEAIQRAYRRTLAMAGHGSVPAGVPVVTGAMEAILERDVFWRGSTGRNLGVLCVRAMGGDGLMDHAAVAVSQATRIADLIFRPSDQELVVLMPDCEPAAGQIIVDRIGVALPRAVVARADLPPLLQMAFACGPYDGDTVRQLLAVARRRMDEAGPATCGIESTVEVPVTRAEGERA
ncbi:MAG: HD domain-containing protein [Acidobacteria bacterium]|nr:HD domain-containing protein [Acidobacteriota bacterium]